MSKLPSTAKLFLELMSRLSSRRGAVIDPVTQVPASLLTKEDVARTDFGKNKDQLRRDLKIPSGTEIVSVFGGSQPFNHSEALALESEMRGFFSSRRAVTLFGTTGRPWHKDKEGRDVFDVNGAVTRCGIPSLAQIVDQTSDAIVKWGCDVPQMQNIAGVIYVTGQP